MTGERVELIENQEKRPTLPPIPLTRERIKESGVKIAAALIDHPFLLPDFFQIVDAYQLTAAVEGNEELSTTMRGLLSEVGRNIQRFDWLKKNQTELDLESCRTILRTLPKTKEEAARTPKQKKDIIYGIAAGFVNDRFETPNSGDWRGSTKSERRFLESAIFPEIDRDALEVWYDIVTQRQQQVSRKYSVSWRASFIATRAADPKDQEILAIGHELDSCTGTLAHIFDKREQMQKNSQDISVYTIQSTAIQSAIIEDAEQSLHLRVLARQGVYLRGNLDPRTGKGKAIYRNSLKALKEIKREEISQKKHDPQEDENLTGFSLDQIREAEMLPVTSDMVESVIAITDHPLRWRIISDKLGSSYKNLQSSGGYIGDASTKFYQGTPEALLVEEALSKKSDLKQQLIRLMSPAKRRDEVRKYIKRQTSENPSIIPIKFSIRRFGQDLSGYLFDPSTSALSNDQSIERVNEVFDSYPDIEALVRITDYADTPLSGIEFPDSNLKVLLVQPEFASKTPTSSLLDITIPEEVYGGRGGIIDRSLALRGEIPSRFTRMPTIPGDRYELANHDDLPGVVRDAVIHKINREGGLAYRLRLMTDLRVFPDGFEPELLGTINFRFNRVNLVPNPANPEISVDQQTVLDSVLINLIARSCAPSINEVIEEQRQLESRGVDLITHIPGYIGHVGGLRSDGTPKQYTERADTNYLRVIHDLFGTTLGISLARINEHHRLEEPGDIRFLTYTRGRDTDALLPPTDRTPPEHII